MKKLIMLILLGTVVLANSACADIQLGKYPRVYEALDSGVQVSIFPLANNNKKALVQVKGVNSKIDGLFLLYSISTQGNEYSEQAEYYRMPWNGQSNVRLKSSSGSYKDYTLYLPDQSRTYSVFYKDKKSKQVDINKIMAIYKASQDSKIQEKLGRFDRSKAIEKRAKHIAKAEHEFEKSCGKKIALQIIWKPISNENLQHNAIVSDCIAPLNILKRMCDDPDYYKTNFNFDPALAIKNINKTVCHVGQKRLQLSLAQNHTLDWTTVPTVANQDEFVLNNLMNMVR